MRVGPGLSKPVADLPGEPVTALQPSETLPGFGQSQWDDCLQDASRQVVNLSGSGIKSSPVPQGAVHTVSEVLEILDRYVLNPRSEASNGDPDHALLREALGPKGPPDVPWMYLPDGCYARAHAVAHVLRNLDRIPGAGLEPMAVGKFFLEGRLRASNALFPDGVHWAWHVTFSVPALDEGSGQLVPVVLTPDPARGAAPGRMMRAEALTPDELINGDNPGEKRVRAKAMPANQYLQPMPLWPARNFKSHLSSMQRTLRTHYDLQAAIQSRMDPIVTLGGAVPVKLDPAAGTLHVHGSERTFDTRSLSPDEVETLGHALNHQAPLDLGYEVRTGKLLGLRTSGP